MTRWRRADRSQALYRAARTRGWRRGPGRSPQWYRKVRLNWWLRLAGWLVLGVVTGFLLGWWLAPIGVLVFEAGLAVLVLRRVRSAGGSPGRGGPGGGMGGVREPRRPLPVSGAGAAPIPR